MRALLAVLALVGAAFVLAPAAAANPPTVTTSEYTFNYVSDWLCGFPVASAGSDRFVTKTFSDSAGVPIRQQMQFQEDGTLTGPTGLVANASSAGTQTTNLAMGILTVDGTLTHIVVPGVGVLLHDAGRVVMTTTEWPPTFLFMAGQQQTLQAGAWEPVCAYLAGL